MDRFAGRMLLLVAVLIVGVFYGISITRDGIAGVYGPLDDATGPGGTSEWRSEPANAETGRPDDDARADVPDEGRTRRGQSAGGETAISRLVGKAGDLARLLADGLIRLFVWLGDAVLS